MLALNRINAHYGKIQVLKDVSLEVREGEIVTLIGANGAGKSTLLKVISGVMRPSSGEISFLGKKINGLTAKDIVRLGISRVPEGRHIFPRMTVRENLQLGSYLRKDKREIEKNLEEVYEHFPVLKKRDSQQAGTMSGGEAQMLAIGRGLMAKPKLFVLDEPSIGLAPLMVMEIARIIIKIFAAGTTILLVEQNARMALSLSHRAYVLERGSIVLQGAGKELKDNEQVKQAYLGGSHRGWRNK
ncbi:MAG: ABC transporter ATP-binding protein [Deltaproteobacteria bacterium]|nr:ABC transporter ATP-binding protein [Deltaproteobacteria bacterium]